MTRDATIADLAPDGRLFSSTRWCAWRSPISRRTNVRQATTHTSILHSGTPRTIVLERTQRLPAPVARRPIQCETMVKKRSDIRCAKARQLEVPIQRGPTECLLVFGPFPRPHVFPFGLIQHGNVHLAAPAIQQLHHTPPRHLRTVNLPLPADRTHSTAALAP